MSNISIGAVIGDSVDTYRNDFISHILATLIFVVVNAFTFSLLAGPLLAGYMRGLRKAEDSGSFDVGDLFSCFNDRLGATLVAGILSLIITSIGYFLCVLPGILLMPILPLSIYQVAVAGESDGVNAIKTGFRLLQENLLMAVITALLVAILGGIGSLACGVGIILTMPLINIGWYLLAQQASGDEPIDVAPA